MVAFESIPPLTFHVNKLIRSLGSWILVHIDHRTKKFKNVCVLFKYLLFLKVSDAWLVAEFLLNVNPAILVASLGEAYVQEGGELEPCI